MEIVNDYINEIGINLILLIMASLIVVLLLMTLSYTVKVNRMSKRYKKFIGDTKSENLEAVVINIKEQFEKVINNSNALSHQFEVLSKKLSNKKGNVAIHRYNAYTYQENSQSFIVAIMDDEQSGLLLNVLNNESGYYIYGKNVINGESDYKISKEEQVAIQKAIGTHKE